jgi:hypothetical protein
MSGSPMWVEAWKTMAESRIQMLDQMLSKPAVSPLGASLRNLYVKRAQAVARQHLSIADAYVTQLKAFNRIVEKAAGRTSSGSSKGSLGDSG